MAVTTFIPEVWAAQLLVALDEWTVLGQPGVSNRDYEGDIAAYGDTVHINTLGRPTIDDYVKYVTDIDPEALDTTDETLVIDQAKYFAFEVDDVDMRQARNGGALLNQAADQAAQGLALAADTYLTTTMTAGAGTALGASDVSDGAGAFDVLREIKVSMDGASVPMSGRWVTVAPEFYSLLLDNDRFLDASAYGSSAPIRAGEVGTALGFSVLLSNTLPEGTAGTPPEVSNFVIGGHPMATTWATQISKTEAYRPQNAFSDAIKGLHLYGALVVRPEALVTADIDVTL